VNDYVRFTLVLSLVCLAAAVGVGSVYVITRPSAEARLAMTEDQARATVLPGARVFREVKDGSGVFAAREEKDGLLLGYVATGEGWGYGGRLLVMVGMTPELVVTKAVVLQEHETPGLGKQLAKVQTKDTLWSVIAGTATGKGASWMDQFEGKRKDKLRLGAGIDAKTGCTVTSRAVIQAAEDAVTNVEDALGIQGAKTGEE
jgi:Na+-translocating ferredoxin:NAD+ oxidoreductase RnfG subunit